ncbi:protein of unknown function [Candidatus Nitrotoga arctica]|uniref:Uncharacterized protein n=1 Tax=Candidatus Nitrotoga arctica TaxID=453162 RepID=A0ABM8YZ66_9PROT|nr:protein of unknown function [Candidatus Nitrotoga arctica]
MEFETNVCVSRVEQRGKTVIYDSNDRSKSLKNNLIDN